METYATLIAASPWFGLIAGIASILGCLLAVYPVQIATIQASVYRVLVWQRTLVWSVGFGLMVFSGIHFYAQIPPRSGTLLGQIYNFAHGLPSLDRKVVRIANSRGENRGNSNDNRSTRVKKHANASNDSHGDNPDGENLKAIPRRIVGDGNVVVGNDGDVVVGNTGGGGVNPEKGDESSLIIDVNPKKPRID